MDISWAFADEGGGYGYGGGHGYGDGGGGLEAIDSDGSTVVIPSKFAP